LQQNSSLAYFKKKKLFMAELNIKVVKSFDIHLHIFKKKNCCGKKAPRNSLHRHNAILILPLKSPIHFEVLLSNDIASPQRKHLVLVPRKLTDI